MTELLLRSPKPPPIILGESPVGNQACRRWPLYLVPAGYGKTSQPREFRGLTLLGQEQNILAGCSKRPTSKAAASEGPRAVPSGYVEGLNGTMRERHMGIGAS